MANIGKQLRHELLERNIRAKDFAAAADRAPSAATSWLRYGVPIPAERAQAIARTLGIPLHLMRPDLWPKRKTVRK